MTGKTRRNRARRRGKRDRKAARRIAAIFIAIGVTPKSRGETWSEILNGLRAQYASLTDEQKQEAHAMGTLLIREKSLDELSVAIIAGPSQPKRKDRPPQAPREPGKRLQKCDRCWSWGPKSIWDSRDEAEEFSYGMKDSGLHAYAGVSLHIVPCKNHLGALDECLVLLTVDSSDYGESLDSAVPGDNPFFAISPLCSCEIAGIIDFS